MSWDSADTYREGLTFFTAIAGNVAPDGWGTPSPCAGWSALDVLGHVGQAAQLGAEILRGVAVVPDWSDPPARAVEGDPVVWWGALADAARHAIDEVEDLDLVVDSPMGPRPIRDGLAFPAVDLFIHGWDLGAATGTPVTIPDEAIAFTYALFDKVPDDVARRPTVFGPRRTVAGDASPTAELIAFTGRDPGWSPPA